MLEENSYTIGRNLDNDIAIPNQVISRYHAKLEFLGENWVYKDLGSRNGSFVNGTRIQNTILVDGMTLMLGDKPELQVNLTFHSNQGVNELSDNQLFQDNEVALSGTPEKTLESITGLIELQSYIPIIDNIICIGRDPKSDIHLPAPTVSWHHAQLKKVDNSWVLIDLNSTNGSAVNGQLIQAPKILKENDLVQIGPFRLIYEGEGQLKVFVANRGLRLDGLNLTWEVGKGNERKRILKNINLACSPQEFIGLVGGSGAGKSTLMKALSGLLPTKGQVLVEGEDLYKNFDAYRSQIGYVPQDDILHKELTVQQALWYSAKLRLPVDIGVKEIQQRIDKVLEQVELLGQKDQPILSLSGGQRKRASIAVELLADPPLFFLDEPTSGLDPGLEKKMMVTLRNLANDGKTILLVTHATANITECDQVAFMSQGHLVYYGPPLLAGQFFNVGAENFSEIYAEISDPDQGKSKDKAKKWEALYKLSPFFKKYITERFKTLPKNKIDQTPFSRSSAKRTRVNSFHQFFLLTRRYFDLILRDRILLTILLTIMPILGLYVLLIAEKNWLVGDSIAFIQQQLKDNIANGEKSATYSVVGNGQALLFIMALASVLLGMFASAYEIVKEKNIYIRERMVFLKLLPYLGSKVVLLAGFSALQILFFLVVIGLKIKFPSNGVFLPVIIEVYITLFLGAFTAIMLGLFLSSIAPNSNSVVYLILGVLFTQIMFAGVLFKLPGMAKSFSIVTLSRWTTEALGVSTNLESLNNKTLTRFQPDSVTKDIEMEIEKPDPNWQCFSLQTEMQQFPECTSLVPIQVPEANELTTVKELVNQTVTIEPSIVDIETPQKFILNYERSGSHLLLDWGMLVLLSLLFGVSTLLVMKKKDIV